MAIDVLETDAGIDVKDGVKVDSVVGDMEEDDDDDGVGVTVADTVDEGAEN